MMTQLIIVVGDRKYRFDTNGYQTTGVLLGTAAGGIGGLIGMKIILAQNPVDVWLNTLQQYQFSIRLSTYNNFLIKVYKHIFLTFFINLIATIFLIIVISLIVMTVTGG